jgi:outer membrane murein-binding lipoprotein Lpp
MRRVDVDKPTRRVAVLWSVAAVLAGLMLAGCASARPADRPSAPVPGLPVPASAIHRLTAIADRAIRVNGAGAAAWASAVVTTHEKALTSATPGDTVPIGETTVVYLVTMKGHFIAEAASVPPGGHAPTGIYLSIVVDAKTFQTLDGGLSPRPPPVAPRQIRAGDLPQGGVANPHEHLAGAAPVNPDRRPAGQDPAGQSPCCG